uniref:GDSL-lipase n=1 Tax=Cylindrospermopsis raciborskii T3 TaxID=398006 RepID=B3EYG7_9CYAN|nr:GDSL-lipase [Cylindrospermopsis raciborskii T3]
MSNFKGSVKIALMGILIFCGLIFGVAFVEIGLRIAGIEHIAFHSIDEHRGWVGRPHVSGWYRTEGEAHIQMNSDGFRDREHIKVKPENTFRIALLGDSFVESMQVPLEQNLAAVIEGEISSCIALAGRKAEVINFGVTGYGTDQELITLREKVWDYSPDIVVLDFYTGNDIVDNSRALSQKFYPNELGSLKPFFILRDGNLVVDASFINTDNYRSKLTWWGKTYMKIKDHSRILQVLNMVRDALNNSSRGFSSQAIEEPLFSDGKQDTKLSGFFDIYKPPTDPEWQQAWQVTEKLISSMQHEVTAKKADFLVVTFGGPFQREPLVRQKEMQELGLTDWFYPEKRITRLGEDEGFSVLNLSPNLQVYSEQNNACLYGFDDTQGCVGHWNALGHQVAGKMIASKICQQQMRESILPHKHDPSSQSSPITQSVIQ